MGFFDYWKENNYDEWKVKYDKELGINMIGLANLYNVVGLTDMPLSSATMMVCEDKIMLEHTSLNRKPAKLENCRVVLREDIKKIRVMTREQIEHQSKMGEMMLIGAYALASGDKTKVTHTQYIVLDICEEEIDFSVSTELNFGETIPILDMAKKLNRWRKTGTWE